MRPKTRWSRFQALDAAYDSLRRTSIPSTAAQPTFTPALILHTLPSRPTSRDAFVCACVVSGLSLADAKSHNDHDRHAVTRDGAIARPPALCRRPPNAMPPPSYAPPSPPYTTSPPLLSPMLLLESSRPIIQPVYAHIRMSHELILLTLLLAFWARLNTHQPNDGGKILVGQKIIL
ncbi:hypothetical protein B0H14DRAFT_3457241 [Mycena olivaceomarginata]|nr:hypothetical protein B0H14DRAFT_3457241 [Mycena olivaceomarginata]